MTCCPYNNMFLLSKLVNSFGDSFGLTFIFYADPIVIIPLSVLIPFAVFQDFVLF